MLQQTYSCRQHQAKIDILPNIHNVADAITDRCMVTQGIEIGSGGTRKGETSTKDYVSLSITMPEFEPMGHASLTKVADADDEDLFAVIWNPGD